MKKTLALLLFVGASVVPAFAQSTACPVRLSAIVTYDAAEDFPTRIKIGKRNLVSEPENKLVLILDQDTPALRLVEIDSETNEVAVLAESTICVFLPGNHFAGDLEFDSLEITHENDDFAGEAKLQLRGQFSVDDEGNPYRIIKAALLGVLDDPLLPAMIKGDFTSDGRGFDADEAGL
ncbi:MAG: hypothetical protein PCFJNLEI_01792 [Verrucomicrobiae bacterium]|nr:hypothetical protein [Verrucomicrobiae bacterium]